jgi:UDP-N-acetylglucosamine acyltransferase
MTSVSSVLLQDMPPYVMASGSPAQPRSINAEGLKRRGFSSAAITAIRRAFKTLYRQGHSLDEARALIAAEAAQTPELAILAEFIAEPGRGIIR